MALVLRRAISAADRGLQVCFEAVAGHELQGCCHGFPPGSLGGGDIRLDHFYHVGSQGRRQHQLEKTENDILFADHYHALPLCRYYLSVVCIWLFRKEIAG